MESGYRTEAQGRPAELAREKERERGYQAKWGKATKHKRISERQQKLPLFPTWNAEKGNGARPVFGMYLEWLTGKLSKGEPKK